MKRASSYWLSVLLLLTILLGACVSPPTVETTATEPSEPEMMATKAPEEETEEPNTVPTDTQPNQIELPMVDPGAVTGDIIAAGSSTVYPLSEAMAERFEGEGYSGKLTIDSIGSGAGFERFCEAGETDIV